MTDELSAQTTPRAVQVSRQLDALLNAFRQGAFGDWDDPATQAEWAARSTPLVADLRAAAAADDDERAQLAGAQMMGAVGTPLVVAGELIETAWGNQVRADLVALDSGKLGLSSGGQLTAQTSIANGLLPYSGPGTSLFPDGRIRNAVWDTAAGSNLVLNRSSAAAATGQPLVQFGITGANTGIGSITLASLSSVAYNTSSDPRLKLRTADHDASALVQAIGRQAYRGRWIADDDEGDEWIFVDSTVVEQHAPFAVSGDADAVDDDGEIVAQQVNYQALVPALFAALADALDRLDAIEQS